MGAADTAAAGELRWPFSLRTAPASPDEARWQRSLRVNAELAARRMRRTLGPQLWGLVIAAHVVAWPVALQTGFQLVAQDHGARVSNRAVREANDETFQTSAATAPRTRAPLLLDPETPRTRARACRAPRRDDARD